MDCFKGDDLNRLRYLVREIDDFMNAIRTEVNGNVAYKSYLKEKVSGLATDVRCIESILDADDE